MRLLLLNHNYRYGGTYYRAMPIAEQLAARGHTVTLMTVSPRQQWRVTWSNVQGVRVSETPNWGQNNSGEGYGPLDNLYRLGYALAHRYDVVHMFDHKPNATFAGFTGRLRGARLVADWADWWGGPGGINDVPQRRVPAVGAFEAWWEEQSKSWADGVVTISTVLQQRALNMGVAPSRVLYLPTGAATERIQPVPLTEARAKLGLPLDRRMVGFIGMGQGDLEIVMNAIRPLHDVWLMVVGAKNQRVYDQAVELGVAARLWQTDFVRDEEVSNYLSCADLMVLPLKDNAANRGRLPNKLLDYLCVGRPVVVSPVGDVRDIVTRYDVGMVADTTEFSSAIAQFLADDDARRRMGQQARRAATTVFAWPSLIERLEKFYQSLR